jgi:hypothetical protein
MPVKKNKHTAKKLVLIINGRKIIGASAPIRVTDHGISPPSICEAKEYYPVFLTK